MHLAIKNIVTVGLSIQPEHAIGELQIRTTLHVPALPCGLHADLRPGMPINATMHAGRTVRSARRRSLR